MVKLTSIHLTDLSKGFMIVSMPHLLVKSGYYVYLSFLLKGWYKLLCRIASRQGIFIIFQLDKQCFLLRLLRVRIDNKLVRESCKIVMSFGRYICRVFAC